MKIWQMKGFVCVRFTVTATLLRCQHVHVLCCQESKTRWLQEASPCTWTNCLMKESVFLAVCVGVSLCGSHLRKWVTKSNRQTVVLPSSRNPMYKCVSLCVLAQFHSSLHLNATGLCPDFSRHSSYTTYCFVLPTLIIQVEGQNKGRGYCGCVCACVCSCVCVCITRGWRLREGGGVVGNRSVLQMLQGRRTERKVLWLSVVQQHSLTRKGMPHVAPSQLRAYSLRSCWWSNNWNVGWNKVTERYKRWEKRSKREEERGEKKKEEKHVY